MLKQACFGGPAVAKHWLDHLPYVGVNSDHNLDTAIGRERERLELTMLQEGIDPYAMSPHISDEFNRLGRSARWLPTIGQLVKDQIDGTIVHLKKPEDRSKAPATRPSPATNREELRRTA